MSSVATLCGYASVINSDSGRARERARMRDSGVDIDILLTRPQTNLWPQSRHRDTHMWMPPGRETHVPVGLATIEECKRKEGAGEEEDEDKEEGAG